MFVDHPDASWNVGHQGSRPRSDLFRLQWPRQYGVSDMTLRFVFSGPTEDRWEELRTTDLSELSGLDGLIHATTFLLWTAFQIEQDGEPLLPDPASVSLVTVAFSLPQIANGLLLKGHHEWQIGYGGPRLVVSVVDEWAELHIYPLTFPMRPVVPPEPLTRATCPLNELIFALTSCAEDALSLLREGMAGPLEPVLGEWIEIVRPVIEPVIDLGPG